MLKSEVHLAVFSCVSDNQAHSPQYATFAGNFLVKSIQSEIFRARNARKNKIVGISVKYKLNVTQFVGTLVTPFIVSSTEAKCSKIAQFFMVRVWFEFSRRDTHYGVLLLSLNYLSVYNTCVFSPW